MTPTAYMLGHLTAMLALAAAFFNFLILHSEYATETEAVVPRGRRNQRALLSLDEHIGQCIEFHQASFWWTYAWCHEDRVIQYHANPNTGEWEGDVITVGKFDRQTTKRLQAEGGSKHIHIYSEGDLCEEDKRRKPLNRHRRAEVEFQCCPDKPKYTEIRSVRETTLCEYKINICTPLACDMELHNEDSRYQSTRLKRGQREKNTEVLEKKDQSISAAARAAAAAAAGRRRRGGGQAAQREDPGYHRFRPEGAPAGPRGPMPAAALRAAREAARELFYHAYEGYMNHGFPLGEVTPLSCQGVQFDLCKLPMVTLIDSLDTLLIMGNHTEFERAVWQVADGLPDFDLDLNVSVFETNIRVVGGLLSAHALAASPRARFAGPRAYGGELLALAADLGERLLPAFDTKTGIPYGTVNLAGGGAVPPGETPVASTAGGGSLSLELAVLSALTGDPRFGDAAARAVRALFDRRSKLGLLGKHIDVRTGRWTEGLSGIGSNSDSFYEYLIKMYCMFGEEEFYQMFLTTYGAIERYNRAGDWYNDVDMNTGAVRRRRFENLMAFWPGTQLLIGDMRPAQSTLNAMFKVWRSYGFIPEEFDFVKWELVDGGTSPTYPLRPELIESTLHMYEATKDSAWLWAGKDFLDSLQYTKGECGYATINVGTLELEDTMPSFFLAETAKYLYLLFDRDNFIHQQPYIFSTEAHPFLATDFLQGGNQCLAEQDWLTKSSSSKSTKPGTKEQGKKEGTDETSAPVPFTFDLGVLGENAQYLQARITPIFPWWEDFSYDTQYLDTKTGRRSSSMEPRAGAPPTCPRHTHGLAEAPYRRPTEALRLDFGPDLGLFKILASQGGFRVTSERTEEVMDVAVLGKGLLFVRDHAEEAQGGVIADRHGNAAYCYVRLRPEGGEDAGYEAQLPCAVGAFGPTRDLDEVGPISGPAALPIDDSHGCNDSPTQECSDALSGKIVLVQRGVCMFEEKAQLAEKHGASGVVVINNSEDGDVFVMAGIEHGKNAPPSTTIPTVMVSKENGNYLKKIVDKFARKNKKLDLELSVVKKRVTDVGDFVQAIEENQHYPQVLVAMNGMTMYAMGQGDWGIMLVTKTGVEWQLVVIDRESFFDPEELEDLSDVVMDVIEDDDSVDDNLLETDDEEEEEEEDVRWEAEEKEEDMISINNRKGDDKAADDDTCVSSLCLKETSDDEEEGTRNQLQNNRNENCKESG